MKSVRKSGVLLPVTALPGPWGIGDFGPEAYRFVDLLARCSQSLWQVLPLGPLGWGYSPYQSLSAFAGNPLLISPEKLVEEGLLMPAELEGAPTFPAQRVEYETGAKYKGLLLRKSFERFILQSASELERWEAFCEQNAGWLTDWVLFMALKEAYGGGPWTMWEMTAARREPVTLRRLARKLAQELRYQQYLQYQFFQQWQALKQYANEHNVQIVGDLPIYVAHDSAEVWAHRELFSLAEDGTLNAVGGVPPDYFSKTGQRWGNPLYRWEHMARTGFQWWVERLRWAFALFDLVVLDHFRGLEAYWEVPASSPTAAHGRWALGPGTPLLEAAERSLGLSPLPCIAEDLGVITTEVEDLRDRFGIPGMKVLQFAFDGDPRNSHLPHNYTKNCVVYTGTHNNDTTVGWFRGLAPEHPARAYLLSCLGPGAHETDIQWHLVRLAMASVAMMAIIPLQDVLGLSSQARINTPGTIQGNWQWRFQPQHLVEDQLEKLSALTRMYGRA